MSGPEAALAVVRILHDAATMFLWGAFADLAALVPRDLEMILARRLEPFRRRAVTLAVLTTFAALPIEAAEIGDGWTAASDSAVLSAVLFETSVGHAWQAQAVAALLLAATLVAPDRLSSWATAGASGLLLVTLALTGHAAIHEGWLGLAHRMNDILHVLAGGAWLGALVPLLPILRALGDENHRHHAGIALRRFSTFGHGAVALVIATGVVNTGLVLGRWPTDWSSGYQALLALKIALVFVLVVIALANRYVLVPRMALRPHAIHVLRRTTIAEIGLGLAVIGGVGVFGLLEPV